MLVLIDKIKVRISIRANPEESLINPLVVTNRFVLVDGLRRLLALKKLGVKDVEVKIIRIA